MRSAKALLEGIAPPLLNWFINSFTGNRRGDILGALSQQTDMRKRIHELTLSVNRHVSAPPLW